MKSRYWFGFTIFCLFLCTSCAAHYRVKHTHVEHISWDAAHGKTVRRLNDADPSSFRQLLPWYGKDRENVFWRFLKVEGAHSESFRAINNYYGADKFHGIVNDRVIKESDGETFEYLGNNWSRDSKNYFYGFTRLDLCDYKTFRIIEGFLSDRAIDEECYYYGDRKVPVSDRRSLQVLESGYAKDKNAVYWGAFPILEADSDTFEVWKGHHIARDKNMCYIGPAIATCHRLNEEAKKYCRCADA